jgi:putative Mg2+ transporter-C (MgtC) family protein
MPDLSPWGMRLVLEAEMVVRVLVAGLLSAALGWERERAGKPAGFRTHIIVGVAAALFVIAGILTVEEALLTGVTLNLDPTRTIHAIAVGVGFLGGGVVFVSRNTDRVQGLTTAASIWATAGVGAAVGYGLYVLATATTILLLVVLHKLAHLDISSDAMAEKDARHAGRNDDDENVHGGPGRRHR